MKKGFAAAVCLLALVSLTGCSKRLPDVPDNDRILADIPEALTTITLNGIDYAVTPSGVVINGRDTDLDHQVDDVDCTFTLEGDGVTAECECILNYAYVRETGWTIRDYSFASTPVLSVDPNSNSMAGILVAEGQQEVSDQLGYDSVIYADGGWDPESNNNYHIYYSVGTDNAYLAMDGTVEVIGSLTYAGSGLVWNWTSEINTDSLQKKLALANGTAWQLYVEDQNYEIVFEVTDTDSTSLTFTGLVYSPAVASDSKIVETDLNDTVPWSLSDHDSISFSFYAVDQTITVHISNEEKWVDLESGEELGLLENVPIPESGDLSELMHLKVSEDAYTWPWEKWFDKSTGTASDSSTSAEEEESTPTNKGSVSDFLRDVFGLVF